MKRRTVIGWLLSALATLPFGSLRLRGQSAQLSSDAAAALGELASAVLPSSDREADSRLDDFQAWLSDYRSGADMGFGYGILRHRVTPTIDVTLYERQLLELMRAATDRGTTLASMPVAGRLEIVEASMRQYGIEAMPSRPDGRHVVSDFMSHYYFSSDAHDLAYQARIGRNVCRGLTGMGDRPAPL